MAFLTLVIHPCWVGVRRILLVADGEGVGGHVAGMVERAGYDVVAATDAEDAFMIACSDERGFDLLLSDVTLTAGSGLELAWKLRASGLVGRVMFMSVARVEAQTWRDAPLIQKPFTADDLTEKVHEALTIPVP